MTVGRVCNRDVVISRQDSTMQEIAALMREYHVGDVVLVADRAGLRVPVGIVTDRDIVIEVVAAEIALDEVAAGDIASGELVTVREDDSLWDALQRMRVRGVRRMPVVDARGALVGILTLDDLLELLSSELAELTALIKHEQAREQRTRP